MRPRGTPCRGEYTSLARLPMVYAIYTVDNIATVISPRALKLAAYIREIPAESLMSTLIEYNVLNYELGEVGLLLKMFPQEKSPLVYEILKNVLDIMLV
jgi:hypothetical protein